MSSSIEAMAKFSEMADSVAQLNRIAKALRILGMDTAADEILFTIVDVKAMADDGRQLISNGMDEDYQEVMKNTGNLLGTLVNLSLKEDGKDDRK